MNRKSTLAVLVVSALTASYMGVNAAAGTGSYEAGDGASASGQNSVAVGHESKAVGNTAIAIGSGATSNILNGIAIGIIMLMIKLVVVLVQAVYLLVCKQGKIRRVISMLL